MNITLVIGLPGSGKSYLLSLYEPYRRVIIDDVSINSDDLNLVQPDTKHLVITDISCCDKKVEQKAIEYLTKRFENRKPTIDFIYFENNLEQCWENVKSRNDNRAISYHFLRNLSAKYTPDTTKTVLRVYQPKMLSV